MKRIVILSVLLITLVSAFYNCLAFDIGTKQLKNLGNCEIYLKYKGAEKNVPFIVYEKDGKQYPAYCLNPHVNGIGTSGTPEYSVSGTTRLENENVWKALINGYPYKTIQELGVNNKEEAFTATKFAAYTMLENRNIADYEPVNTDAGRRTYQAYLKIVSAARNSKETLKDSNKIFIVPENKKWDIDNIDNQYVSRTYRLNSKLSNGTYDLTLDAKETGILVTNLENKEQTKFNLNEKFKVLVPLKLLEKDINFRLNAKSVLETKPIVYGKTSIPDTQDYAISGYMTEDASTYLEDNCSKDITKIRIIKKEYGTEKRLQGVKFNLLDSNRNMIKEGLTTNENGEIIIEKILPGKYYIQEKETLQGYNLYEDLVEVNIKFNEEVQIIINNTTKSVSEIITEKDIVEVISNYTETLYNVNETKVISNKKLPVTGY